MNELITHAEAFKSALQIDHTPNGGRDLSGAAQVQIGMWADPPLQTDFCCLAPRGFRNATPSNLTAWTREYSFDFRAFARAARDTPTHRIEAAAAMAQGLVHGLQSAFLDESGPSAVYLAAHAFRVEELDLFDLHEIGGSGPWGLVSGTAVYRVHGRDEGVS